MPHHAQREQPQQFEQLMTTVFTCRSVVKYNLVLSEEQKGELLIDIDGALEILRAFMIAGPAQPAPAMPPAQFQASAASPPAQAHSAEPEPSFRQEHQTLQALYKMYYTYLDMNQSSNLSTFISRFNEAIAVINEIQHMAENDARGYDGETHNIPQNELLQRLRLFVTDIYYMFMEFVRVLSDTLQQNNVQLDTEKLSSLHNDHLFIDKQTDKHDLKPLFSIYEAHQQLSQKKALLIKRIGDITAFLEFLKESFPVTMHKHEEVISQLTNAIKLLADLSRLLTDYEKVVASLLSLL